MVSLNTKYLNPLIYDINNFMLNNINMGYYKYYSACIVIMSNVFISSALIFFN